MQLETILLYCAFIICASPFLYVICGAIGMVLDDITKVSNKKYDAANKTNEKESIKKLIKIDIVLVTVLAIGIALLIFL